MFDVDFQDRKRLQALERLNDVRRYKQYGLVRLVQENYRQGFLEQEERDFLNWTLGQHGIDYTIWSHKTKGLKKIMAEMKTPKAQKPVVVQLPLFPDMDTRKTIAPTANIPVAMLEFMKKVKIHKAA